MFKFSILFWLIFKTSFYKGFCSRSLICDCIYDNLGSIFSFRDFKNCLTAYSPRTFNSQNCWLLYYYFTRSIRPSTLICNRSGLRNWNNVWWYGNSWLELCTVSTRHTFASLLADLGVPSTIRSKLIGHSIGNVTEAAFTHLDMSGLLNAVNKLECFIE